MHVALILAIILGLKSDWRPDACERTFSSEENREYCKHKQEEGFATATTWAGFMAEEADRFSLPSELLPTVAFREFGLSTRTDCILTLDATKVTSRELLDEEMDRWEFCWSYGSRTNCQPVILLADDEVSARVRVDRCAYGEVGLFQVRSHEIPSGYELPWGDVLSTRLSQRRSQAWDPRVNIHLGARALAEAREMCCEEEDEACRGDWHNWVHAYNTGRCRASSGVTYRANLDRHLSEAREYVCRVLPDHEFCT